MTPFDWLFFETAYNRHTYELNLVFMCVVLSCEAYSSRSTGVSRYAPPTASFWLAWAPAWHQPRLKPQLTHNLNLAGTRPQPPRAAQLRSSKPQISKVMAGMVLETNSDLILTAIRETKKLEQGSTFGFLG